MQSVSALPMSIADKSDVSSASRESAEVADRLKPLQRHLAEVSSSSQKQSLKKALRASLLNKNSMKGSGHSNSSRPPTNPSSKKSKSRKNQSHVIFDPEEFELTIKDGKLVLPNSGASVSSGRPILKRTDSAGSVASGRSAMSGMSKVSLDSLRSRSLASVKTTNCSVHSSGTCATESSCSPNSRQGQRRTVQIPLRSTESLSVTFDLDSNRSAFVYDRAMDDDCGNKTTLWWSSEELAAYRAKLKASDGDLIIEYLDAYGVAQKQVMSENRLSSGPMTDLVRGLRRGYRGLENFSSVLTKARRVEKKNAVLSILSIYQMVSKPGKDVTQILRAHSASLSSKHRQWAVALGRADHAAAYGTSGK